MSSPIARLYVLDVLQYRLDAFESFA